MTTRSSKGSLPNLAYEWVKPGVPAWFEVRDDKGLEVYEFRPAIVKGITQGKTHAHIIFTSDNSEKEVPLIALHQRNLEPSLVSDLTEIPILNDAELLTHVHLLYQNNEIYCYCGPSLIAINPYRNVPHTVAPETMALIKLKLRKRALDQAPPHVWTISAQAYKNLETDNSKQAICVNGESGAGKTESTKKCLEFLTQLQNDLGSVDTNDLSDKILACNPILEAFGNSKTLRNDNSSRFGKYVKIYYNPKDNFKIMGATMDNYLLEKSRVVSITKDERGFHIFYAACRFMPLAQQKQYYLAQNGQPCDLSRFKILRASGLYEAPKVNDKEFYAEVVNAFKILEFSPEEQDAIWRIISVVLHMGNFEVDSSRYEEGKTPCSIVENNDFITVVRLLDCDPESLQQALTLRVRQVQTQIIRTPHRPENVIDFFLSMAKDMYNNLFNWIVKKINVVLAKSLSSFPKLEKLKTIGLLDIFGFEIFDKNYIEQLFINYANERLQGLYIDHIFKNECTIFKSEGLDKYVALITYKDNLGLIKALDSNVTPPGVFPLTNQICRLNQKDENLMGELRKVHSKPSGSEAYITFHKIKQNLFYVRHTAREVEYTIDGFVEKSRDEISLGIVRTIEASHSVIARIYRGVTGPDMPKEEAQQPNPNAKFLSYKFCLNMDQLMDELHQSSCHFIRCVKPNELKKPDTWVGYLVLKQITYMGLLDSLKVRKYNYPVRFKHDEFYKRYQDIDTNKEGSMNFNHLEEARENFRKLAENLLACVGIAWGERDLLIGKTRIFINEPFKYKLDEILKVKQKAKREALDVILYFYKNQLRRQKVANYIKGVTRSIQLARNTLASINAKVEYVRFKRQMQLIRRFQYNFKITLQYRNMALHYNKAKFIAKVCKLKLIQSSILKALKVKRALAFVKAKIRAKVYRNRYKFCSKVVNDLFDDSWKSIKSRYAENSALDIQRHFRAHVQRKKHAPAVKVLHEKVQNQIIFRSLTLIQSNIKGLLVRIRFKKLQMAVKVIQGFFRSRWLRNYYLKLRQATIRIQRNFRKFYWKNSIIATKLQEFVDSSHNMRHFALREYESLLGALPFEIKTSEIVDYEFQKWTKKLVSADPAFQKFLPSSPEVELTPKAKLFAIPFDLCLTSETLEPYPGTWSGELKSFMKKITERGERLLHVIPGDSSTFCVTDDLRVYSFGANDQGQLCTEDAANLFSGRVREVLNLSKNPALQLTLGKDTGSLVSQSGRVFFWGKYTENQLGLKSKKSINGIFVQNALKEEAVSISVRGAPGPKGEELTYIVGKSGQVYVLGMANDDELDYGNHKNYTNGNGSMQFSEAERDFEYKEIQRKHHQSITTAYNENNNVNGKTSAISYKILEIEDDAFKESTRTIRKTSPVPDKSKTKNLEAQQNLLKEIDPYKKIIFISSGSDFSMLLSDKGILFGLGENRFGELGLGDELKRLHPSPINTLRRANEKIEEVSCGFKHVVCRTNLGKVYTWGLGSSYQTGHSRAKNTSSPQEFQFAESQVSSLLRIRNAVASAFGTYFFFEDGSLYMLGKCGPGTFSVPNKLPYNTRMFMGKMKEEFVPVKVFANWSSMISVGYIVFLDFRDVETAKNYKEKIAGLVSAKWRSGNVLPSFDENLHKYVQSKNLLKDKPASMFIDIRYANTSDGRPRSVRHLQHGEDLSDQYSINQGILKQQHMLEGGNRSSKNSPIVKGNPTKDSKNKLTNGFKDSNGYLPNKKSIEDVQRLEAEALNKRLDELNNLNKTNTQKAKVGRPPIIAPPLKGYKEEALKVKVLKVDDNDRILSAQSVTMPQRAYHKANKLVSKSPEKSQGANIFQQSPSPNKNEPPKQRPTLRSRSKSKSQPLLENASIKGTLISVVNNERARVSINSKAQIVASPKNIFKDHRELGSSSNEKAPARRQSSLIKHSNTKTQRETLFDMDPELDYDGEPKSMTPVKIMQRAKPESTFLKQASLINGKAKITGISESPFILAGEESKPKELNPALKRGTPSNVSHNHTPNPNNTFLNFNNNSNTNINTSGVKNSKVITKNDTIDFKSKDGLFSHASSKQEISFTQQPRLKKSDVRTSKATIKEPEVKAKPALHESIFQEVEKIMKKDPTKWTNIEKEIINSYVKLTKSMTR